MGIVVLHALLTMEDPPPLIPLCEVCKNPAVGACSHCKKQFYCGTKCQHADWEAHSCDDSLYDGENEGLYIGVRIDGITVLRGDRVNVFLKDGTEYLNRMVMNTAGWYIKINNPGGRAFIVKVDEIDHVENLSRKSVGLEVDMSRFRRGKGVEAFRRKDMTEEQIDRVLKKCRAGDSVYVRYTKRSYAMRGPTKEEEEILLGFIEDVGHRDLRIRDKLDKMARISLSKILQLKKIKSTDVMRLGEEFEEEEEEDGSSNDECE